MLTLQLVGFLAMVPPQTSSMVALSVVEVRMLRWRIALDSIRGIVTFLELAMVTTLIAIAKALLEMGSWWTLCNSIVQNSESRLLDLVCGHHVLILAF